MGVLQELKTWGSRLCTCVDSLNQGNIKEASHSFENFMKQLQEEEL
jgi:hypothetical protein